jgi:hypothetical protein
MDEAIYTSNDLHMFASPHISIFLGEFHNLHHKFSIIAP